MTPAEIARITDHDTLLSRWEADRYVSGGSEGFLKDGPVDRSQFDREPRRVLFILKDPSTDDYRQPRFQSDLRVWATHADSVYGSTWLNVARWARAALSGPHDDADSRAALSRPEADRILARIAVVNLKKSAFNARGEGNTTADHLMVHAYARRDRDLLRRQVALIAPHLIVGCGVAEPMIWLFDLTPEELKGRAARKADGAQVHVVRHSAEAPQIVLTRHPGRAPVRPEVGPSVAEELRTVLLGTS